MTAMTRMIRPLSLSISLCLGSALVAPLATAMASGTLARSPINCADPQSTHEMLYCADQSYRAADAKLNAAWPAVRAHFRNVDQSIGEVAILPPGAKLSEDLIVDAQLAWIRHRDAECRAETAAFSNGSLRPVLVLGCMTRLTHERTRELQGVVLSPAGTLDERAETEFEALAAELPECRNTSSNVEYKYCLGQIAGAADRRLNDSYKILSQKFEREFLAEDRDALIDSERAWITIRDSECEARARINIGGTGYTGFLSVCNAGRTIIRTQQLNALLDASPEGY